MSRICPSCKIPHPEPEACVEALQKALSSLVMRVGQMGFCSACGAGVYWITHLNGKRAPYTQAGFNHFIDCPRAEQFRKGAV